ncbi:ATP-binding protein [Streptomyces sp. NPDC060194]|uniref:ATP-binding response regulator n=1 Tax=Streptomyces sp. NPDC060194 TaxID=3347069 RepID=UPI003647C830
MTAPEATLVVLPVLAERDVFVLRRHGQALCRALGMQGGDAVRLATVLSEVGRDLVGAPGLVARLVLSGDAERRLVASFQWGGESAPSADVITAAERLLDDCRYSGTPPRSLTLTQRLPTSGERPADQAAHVRAALRGLGGIDMSEELRSQNHDLLAALQQSRAQQEELQRLNAELEETNQGVVALYTELSSELEATNTGVVALYAELEEKTHQLAMASEAKTRFWANVSHELRSPVNNVIGLARLLLDPEGHDMTEEQRQQISLISASGSTLLALVEELLDVAKAESGRLEPVPADTDLRTLLHQLRGVLRGTVPPGVGLVIPDPDPPCPLVTDEVMLTRILRNLLSNSLKFTTAGEVRLDVACEVRAEREWFTFTVTDTGTGIPADQQERVFEEFYQVRGPHQAGRPGTGLGLPYARRLAELLGGRLALESTPGAGTRVTVELPARIVLDDAGPAASDETPLPRLRSLVVVDDDQVFLDSLRPVLQTLADSVTEVTRSSEAMTTIRTHRPQAVLLDLFMPPPNGYRLLEQLARDPELAPIPVLLLTATDHTTLDRSRLAHARAVLGKTDLTAGRLARLLVPHPSARPDEDDAS